MLRDTLRSKQGCKCYNTVSVVLCDSEPSLRLANTNNSPNRVPKELLQASHRPLPMVGPEGESKTPLFRTRCCTLSSWARFGFLRCARLSVSAFRVSLSRLPPHCCLGSTLSGQTETADRLNCLTPFSTVNGLNCILWDLSNRCCSSMSNIYREARCDAHWQPAMSVTRAGAICVPIQA